MWQTKWSVGKQRVKVGRPVEIATSVIYTRDDIGSNGGDKELSEFNRLVKVTWHHFLTDNMGCEKTGD